MGDPLIVALEKLVQGVQLIGDGLTLLLTFALSLVGLDVPEVAIRIGTIILVVLTLWKLSGAVSKIVLYAMIFLLISLFAGLIPAVAQLFSGW